MEVGIDRASDKGVGFRGCMRVVLGVYRIT